MNRIVLVCFLILLSLASLAWAQSSIPSANENCVIGILETTPSSDFIIVGEGIVRHRTTGLEWQRCALGQEWNAEESTCDGSRNTYTWQESLQAANEVDGWRLPNINELRSIVEECRTNPAINVEVFPSTPGRISCWSASPQAYSALTGYAWRVNFDFGFDDEMDMTNKLWIRLVRGGE